MSFSSKDGIPVAVVKGGQSNKEIVYLEDPNEKKSKIVKTKAITQVCVEDGKFEVLPREGIRVLYITGASGSGKSMFAGCYVKHCMKKWPKAKFYVFSQLSKDPAFDDLKPHRITLSEDLIENPINLENDIEPNSIILFDDCSDNEEPLQKAIDRLETQLLVHGRKHNIQVIITSHLLNPGANKHIRHRLNETQALVFFPQSGSAAQLTHSLKTQFGFSTRQVQAVLQIESRWVCCTKTYPNILLSEQFITFARDIGKK